MRIRWDREDGAVGSGRVVCEDGQVLPVTTDFDYPLMAVDFGWSPELVQPRRNEVNPCDHGGCDGTVGCRICGTTSGEFIESAFDFLQAHDGAEAEDPGYFSPIKAVQLRKQQRETFRIAREAADGLPWRSLENVFVLLREHDLQRAEALLDLLAIEHGLSNNQAFHLGKYMKLVQRLADAEAGCDIRLCWFMRSYAATALWCTTDDDDVAFDQRFELTDFSYSAWSIFMQDCETFLRRCQQADLNLTDDEMNQAGGDFWLTRCGHGSGFGDNEARWHEIAEQLEEVAHQFKDTSIYESGGLIFVGC